MSRFKLDENVPARAVDVLRQGGHDVVTVLEHMPPYGSIWILEPQRIRAWNVGD